MTVALINREVEPARPQVFGDVMRRQKVLGGKIAFADTEREVTFADFYERVNRLADALRSKGFNAGDRIALIGRNSVALAEHIATMTVGFILVPLNWRLSIHEIEALLNDCSPKALVCDYEGALVAEKMGLREEPMRICVGVDREGWISHDDLILQGRDIVSEMGVAPDDTALIIYTSGTTGDPKGVMISHRGLVENCLVSAHEAISVNDTDIILCVMPMFHVGGLCYYLLASFAAGSTVVLRPTFDVGDVVLSIDRFSITNIHLVPTMLADLVAWKGAENAVRSLRRIVYAGSSMPIALLRRAMRAFPAVKFSQSYGSTEGGIISSLGPDDHEFASSTEESAHLLESCGKPIKNCDIRIVGTGDAVLPDNDPGEVLVRSQRTMKGYWNKADKTAEVLDGGWLRTGDIGYHDSAGYLYLIDRKNDMIVTGGENVFPSEVEQALCRHRAVAEAAVFSLADDRWVEKVVAAVVLNSGSICSEADLIAFTKQHLASYKCPKQLFILPSLPRTGVGKISRKLLRNRFSNENASPST